MFINPTHENVIHTSNAKWHGDGFWTLRCGARNGFCSCGGWGRQPKLVILNLVKLSEMGEIAGGTLLMRGDLESETVSKFPFSFWIKLGKTCGPSVKHTVNTSITEHRIIVQIAFPISLSILDYIPFEAKTYANCSSIPRTYHIVWKIKSTTTILIMCYIPESYYALC